VDASQGEGVLGVKGFLGKKGRKILTLGWGMKKRFSVKSQPIEDRHSFEKKKGERCKSTGVNRDERRTLTVWTVLPKQGKGETLIRTIGEGPGAKEGQSRLLA